MENGDFREVSRETPGKTSDKIMVQTNVIRFEPRQGEWGGKE